MRVVVVSREAPARDQLRLPDQGVLEQILRDLDGEFSGPVTNLSSPLEAFVLLSAELGARMEGIVTPRKTPHSHTMQVRLNQATAAIAQAFEAGFVRGQHMSSARAPNTVAPTDTDDIGGLSGIVFRSARDAVDALPWLRASLTPSQLLDAFAVQRGVQAVHLVDQKRARARLTRQGGGIIEDGLYALHPKRRGVLVPLVTYHAELLGEMQREARVVLGRLGAKRLEIETVEGVGADGRLVIETADGPPKATAKAARASRRKVVYEWETPTFSPDDSLRDTVMIWDNTGVMTLVDQRKSSNLTRYEEYSQIDTSFGFDLGLMEIFSGGFQWASQSTYRYDVEFFSRTD